MSAYELRLRENLLSKQDSPPGRPSDRAPDRASGGTSAGGAVRPASGPRYGRGSKRRAESTPIRRASESDDPIYARAEIDGGGHARVPVRRNTIHSVLTALPIVMLLVGLWIAHRDESAQTDGTPLRAESTQLSGVYEGVSLIKTSGSAKHYLWLEVPKADTTVLRGFRVSEQQARLARENLTLQRSILVDAAPTVQGSDTYWLWRLSVDGEVLIDDSELLH